MICGTSDVLQICIFIFLTFPTPHNFGMLNSIKCKFLKKECKYEGNQFSLRDQVKKAKILIFKGSELKHLTKDFLDRSGPIKIQIGNANAFEVDKDAFTYVRNLLHVLEMGPLTFNLMKQLKSVRNMPWLLSLKIWTNVCPLSRVIKNKLLDSNSLPRLQRLEILHSCIGDIKKGTLSPLNIRFLKLTNNSLETIPSDLRRLMSKERFKELGLGSNKLRNVLRKWFPVQCFVGTLRLENNNIKCIEKDAFKSCTQLKLLNLSGNVNLHRLDGLNFYRNKIIPFDFELYIMNTSITTLKPLQKLFDQRCCMHIALGNTRIACDCVTKDARDRMVKVSGKCLWGDQLLFPVNSSLLDQLWEIEGCVEPESVDYKFCYENKTTNASKGPVNDLTLYTRKTLQQVTLSSTLTTKPLNALAVKEGTDNKTVTDDPSLVTPIVFINDSTILRPFLLLCLICLFFQLL